MGEHDHEFLGLSKKAIIELDSIPAAQQQCLLETRVEVATLKRFLGPRVYIVWPPSSANCLQSFSFQASGGTIWHQGDTRKYG